MNERSAIVGFFIMCIALSTNVHAEQDVQQATKKQGFFGSFGSMLKSETKKAADTVVAMGTVIVAFIKNFPTIVKERFENVDYFHDDSFNLTISKGELLRDNDKAKSFKALDAVLPFGVSFVFNFPGAGEGDVDFPISKGFSKPVIKYSPEMFLDIIPVKGLIDGILGIEKVEGEDQSIFKQITDIVGPDVQAMLMRLRDLIFIPKEETEYLLKNFMLLNTIASQSLAKKADVTKLFSDLVREELFLLARLSYTIDSVATRAAKAKNPDALPVPIDPLTPLRRFDTVLPGVIQPIVDTIGKIPMPIAKRWYELYECRHKAQKYEATEVEKSVAEILTTKGWVARVSKAQKELVPLMEKADAVDRRTIVQVLFSFAQTINKGLWGFSEAERSPDEQTVYDVATITKRQEAFNLLRDDVRHAMKKNAYDSLYVDALATISEYVAMDPSTLYDAPTCKDPFASEKPVLMPFCNLDGESVLDLLWRRLKHVLLQAKMPGHPDYCDVAVSLNDCDVIERLVALVLFVVKELPVARGALIKGEKEHEAVKAYLKAANLYEEKRKGANTKQDKKAALEAYKDVLKRLPALNKAAFTYSYEMFKGADEKMSLFSLCVKDVFLIMQKASGPIETVVHAVLSKFSSLVGVKSVSLLDSVKKEKDAQEERDAEQFVEDLPGLNELVSEDIS